MSVPKEMPDASTQVASVPASPEPRAFPLGVVLSVTQPRLACDFGDLHGFIEYLVDEPVWTLGLLTAVDPCRAHIVSLYPALADVTMPESVKDEPGIRAWLADLEDVHGACLDVPPMTPGAFTAGGFVGELDRIAAAGKPAIVVAVEGGPR